MKKLLIYVASPYRHETMKIWRRNVDYAISACKNVVGVGHIPIAPHLLYPAFLDDDIPAERAIGIEAGLRILENCDQLWAFADYGISAGMKAEIAKAKELGKKVLILTEGKSEEA